MATILTNAYSECASISKNHYENFPVASIFINKKLRKPIQAIYAFARTADDYADEGSLTKEIRYFKLNQLKNELVAIQCGNLDIVSPIMLALSDAIQQFNLPIQLFYDLLAAFMQDTRKNRYYSFQELFEYCALSANPIGRLMLHLTNNNNSTTYAYSDQICTALQLINMLQDIKQDLYAQNRVYMPLDELTEFGLTYAEFISADRPEAVKQYMDFCINRASDLLNSGTNLIKYVNGTLNIELRLIISSARIVLTKLSNNKDLSKKIRLTKFDIPKILWGAINATSK